MAENTVVKEQLSKEMIEAGAALTAKLDEIGLPVSAAYWMFEPESNAWRLFFATTRVSTEGPRAVYRTILGAIEDLGIKDTLPLSDVGVLEADAGLVRLLKDALRTGPGVSRIRFSRDVVGGRYIDDALIYRAA